MLWHPFPRMRSGRAGWLALRSILLTWLAFTSGAACADPGALPVLELRSAVTAASDARAFPAGAPAQAMILPDEWAETRPEFGGQLWYRLSLPAPDPVPGQELWALYIERVCSNHETFLNGQLVGSGGAMREPVTNNCNAPQWVSLPPALLQPGTNLLDIRVLGHRLAEVGSRQRAGGLAGVFVGPAAELAPRYALRHALALTLPACASTLLLAAGIWLFAQGLRNRGASHLAYLGVLLCGLGAVGARHWLRGVPVSHGVTEFLLLALLAVVTWAAVQFLLRLSASRFALADTGLPAQSALLALTVMAAGSEHLRALALFWYAVFGVELGAAALHHLRRCEPGRPRRQGAAMLVAVGAGLVLCFGLPLAGPLPLPLLALQGLLPMLLVLPGLHLAQRANAAALTPMRVVPDEAVIEARVREAGAEIERNLRSLADQKVEQVTERERKRIAADLHDDLGARLLTIVHTSESERISTLAREALEEMRLSVRGLTGRPVRLTDALGDWRAETVARLAQAGIEGEWHAPDDLPQTLSSRAYVQTTRILREATSNIIKHSGASHCAVRVDIADGDFQLVVRDNGAGISSEVDARLDRGHGLASMKNRAKALQGQCLVESGSGYGTVIRLTLPLDRATGIS